MLRRLLIAGLALLVGLVAAIATISSSLNSVTVPGNGAQTVFSFPFVGVAASDISVIYTNASGVQTTLTQGPGATQYQVTLNAIVPPSLWGVGGTITYDPSGTPIAAGTTLTIVRTLAYQQNVSLQNQSSFGQLAQATEQGLDLLEMQIQQLAAGISHSIQAPLSDPTGLSYTLPSQNARANQILCFDGSGQPTACLTLPSGTVSSAMQPVVDAASLSAGRAAFGLGAAAVLSPNCGLASNLSAAGNLDANWSLSEIASSQAITGIDCGQFFVATGPITLTLARASTLWNGFGFWVQAYSGPITLSINANDTIQGLGSGATGTIPAGTWAFITTDGASSGNWRLLGGTMPNFQEQTTSPGATAYNVASYGAKCDGSTDDTVAINAAIAAVPYAGQMVFPTGKTCNVSGSGSALFTLPQPIQIDLSGATLNVTSASSTTSIFHAAPSTTGTFAKWRIGNGVILPNSHGDHVIDIDTTATDTTEIAEFEVDHLADGPTASTTGYSIYVNNVIGNANGGTFQTNFHDNVLVNGIYLQYAGDSIRVFNNILTGTKYGVYANLTAGAGGLLIGGNNISAACPILIDSAYGVLNLGENEIEQDVTNTCPDNAAVDLRGQIETITFAVLRGTSVGIDPGNGNPYPLNIGNVTRVELDEGYLTSATSGVPCVNSSSTNIYVGAGFLFGTCSTSVSGVTPKYVQTGSSP